MESKEENNKSSAAVRKSLKKIKKCKQKDSNSSVIESSEESTKFSRQSKKYCILYGKCSHSNDSCKHLRAMVIKHKQKKKKNFKTYGKSNKERNALKSEKEEDKNELQHFRKIQISQYYSKKSVSSVAERAESGEILSSTSKGKFFVKCLNNNSKNKIAKPIKSTWIFLLRLVYVFYHVRRF